MDLKNGQVRHTLCVAILVKSVGVLVIIYLVVGDMKTQQSGIEIMKK